MPSVKQERLNSIILKEITNIIQFDLKDPGIGFVTISDVDVSNDHSYATVYVSFLGKDERNQAGLKALNNAKGHIRRELSQRLTTRRCPELIFKLDTSLAYAQKINETLKKIADEE